VATVLTPRRLALAGAIAGLVLVVVGLAVFRDADDDNGHPKDTTTTSFPASRAAAESFVDAWRRSLTGTYLLATRFEREIDGEVRFESEGVTVQRPPDRVVTGGGNVDARLGGRRIACATDPDGTLRCRDAPAADYEDFVAEGVDRVADLVLGPRPLYAVALRGDDCFRLRLRFVFAAPPYGEAARFCFDAETGALVELAVGHAEAIDRTEAVELRARVTDADLELPEEAQPVERGPVETGPVETGPVERGR